MPECFRDEHFIIKSCTSKASFTLYIPDAAPPPHHNHFTALFPDEPPYRPRYDSLLFACKHYTRILGAAKNNLTRINHEVKRKMAL